MNPSPSRIGSTDRQRLRVVLSSNIPWSYQDALALQQAGLLERYICSVGVTESHRWILRFLPKYWRMKLEGRDVSGIVQSAIRTIWLPEIIQKSLRRWQITSPDRADWLNNHLYDWIASRYVDNCDVFHFVSSVGLHSARKAKKRGATLICSERAEHPDYQRQILAEEYRRLGIPYQPLPPIYERKVKAEYALADYIITPSTYARQTYVDMGFREDQVIAFPYGVDLNEFRPLSQYPTGNGKGDEQVTGNPPFRVLFVGQIVPRKGVHYLIQAFEELGLPDADLLLVGPVDKQMGPILDRSLKSNLRIRLAGDIPKSDLINWYGKGSVFVLPSLSDAFPLVCLEAMACGLPVITTDHVGTKEAIREGIDGFVVPTRDVNAIKEKILLLYRNPQLRQQMGQSALDRAHSYTWELYQRQLLSFYEGIMARRGTSHQ